MVPVDFLIEMVKCCYFVGNCKLCPFYKAPKFGMIGSCMGPKKVGGEMLEFLISVKAKEELEQLKQLDLFEGSDQEQAEEAQSEEQGSKIEDQEVRSEE